MTRRARKVITTKVMMARKDERWSRKCSLEVQGSCCVVEDADRVDQRSG